MRLEIRDEALLIRTPHACFSLGGPIKCCAKMLCTRAKLLIITWQPENKRQTSRPLWWRFIIRIHGRIPLSIVPSNPIFSTSDDLLERSHGENTPAPYQRSKPEMGVSGLKPR